MSIYEVLPVGNEHPCCNALTCHCRGDEQVVTIGGHTGKELARIMFASRLDAFFTSMAYLAMQEPTECEQEAWASAFGDGDGC